VRDFDENLVSLRGRLLDVNSAAPGLPVLLIESDDTLVPVRFSKAQDFTKVINLRPGSELSITGVCAVSFDKFPGLGEERRPAAFGLLLRDLDDIRILNAASWWTRGRLLAALGLTGALLLVFLVWSAMLRRKVEVKSTKLVSEMRARRDAEVEFESTLRERNRLAADLHDTTEQALTGLAIQLEVGQALHNAEPKRSLQHFSLALQMLDRSREDLRRSIWNLRANPLDHGTFFEALQQVAADRSIGIPSQILVASEGEARPLEDFVAGNLILLAQEGITNAIKHAKADQIGLKLDYQEKTVSLTVWDDGQGFDPKTAASLKEGHFGLQGMRERIKRLAGTFEIRSSPGKGTSIVATVPS
jgi:signal transduction histidine kinase